MIELLDYILDFDDNFWIVERITNGNAYGYMVYKKNTSGNKYNNITKLNYSKEPCNGLEMVPNYKRIFKPRECYKERVNEIPSIWKKYVEVLNNIGINDIGIFGSFLVGFDTTKDIDFVIYGYDNYKKYKKSIKYIKNYMNATSITKEHIDIQYYKNKDYYSDKCDLKKIISRNWSGIELKNGVLSTPRFIDDNYVMPIKNGIDEVRVVKVVDDSYTDFLPRRATVLLDGRKFEVISSLWKFQSFARNNDKMEIYGNYDYKNNVIILDDMKYYIKYLNDNFKEGFMESLGNKIAKYRLKSNLSQSKLGELLCVSDKTISSWENGRTIPDLDLIFKMANIFKISFYLLAFDDYSNQNNLELEVKLKVNETESNRILRRIKNDSVYLGEEEHNAVYFESKLRKFNKEYLRIRKENNKYVLNYKKSTNKNLCEEYETIVDNPENLTCILEHMDLAKKGEINKIRQNYLYKNKYYFSFDKVENIGDFIEIEVKNFDSYEEE